MAAYNNTPMCSSSSNVFSWKISLEQWTKTAAGLSLTLPFAIMAPTDGQVIKMALNVYPKGNAVVNASRGEGNECIDIIVSGATQPIHPDSNLGKFQIETAYRIKHRGCNWPLVMFNSRSFSCFHSDVFKEFVHCLEVSYEVGSVEDRAEDGFINFEFEIRTFSSPRMKFKFSGNKEEFVNNFQTINPDDGDVKLICETKEFSCHKFLLISQSPVFRAMFQMNSQEKEQNVVNIADCAPEVVEEFVFYLYKGELWGSSCAKPVELMFGLLNLANKYQVDLLKAECVDIMMDLMDVDNVLKIYAVVDKIDLGHQVTILVLDFMKGNIDVIVDKEDWPGFLSDYPSLMKKFVLDMSEELKSVKDMINKDV